LIPRVSPRAGMRGPLWGKRSPQRGGAYQPGVPTPGTGNKAFMRSEGTPHWGCERSRDGKPTICGVPSERGDHGTSDTQGFTLGWYAGAPLGLGNRFLVCGGPFGAKDRPNGAVHTSPGFQPRVWGTKHLCVLKERRIGVVSGRVMASRQYAAFLQNAGIIDV